MPSLLLDPRVRADLDKEILCGPRREFTAAAGGAPLALAVAAASIEFFPGLAYIFTMVFEQKGRRGHDGF